MARRISTYRQQRETREAIAFADRYNAQLARRDQILAAARSCERMGEHAEAESLRHRAMLVEHEISTAWPFHWKKHGGRPIQKAAPRNRFDNRRS